MQQTENSSPKLERTLGPVMLWGLGVGYVISGMYFGWNLGLAEGGTLGLAIATFFIVIMYVTFTFSYTELACAIPKAGGAFDYADKALGRNWGFMGGMAQIIEFVFAPPAIAAAIGAYFNLFLKTEPLILELGTLNLELPWMAILAYFAFTALNIFGVRAAAMFELVITILAVAELLIFAGVTLPEFEVVNLTTNSFPNGIPGIFAAIPFAIWFFLAIEGVANVAEETKNPQRNVLLGFGSAIFTLVILCVLTFVSSVGVGGWEAVVYDAEGNMSDSPLPLAIAQVVGNSGWMYHLLLTIGLLGLVASFHGIILAAGRATYEFGRQGLAPKALGRVHSKFKTPANALIVNMIIGIIALMTGKTGEIITIACFGALALYIISMISFFKLRKNEPDMERPFKVPFYPLFPALALIIASISMVAMIYYNLQLAFIFFGLMIGSFIAYKLTYGKTS
ncbi:MAG: ethanolamine permease [Flavobacteriales bacterium]|nr:ethanolamine permease [Flavobacteriales bacterium]